MLIHNVSSWSIANMQNSIELAYLIIAIIKVFTATYEFIPFTYKSIIYIYTYWCVYVF